MSGVCRGCGGDGLGHHLTPRQRQLALREITFRKRVSYNGARSNQIARIRIAPEPHKARLMMNGPLAHVLSEIERLGKLGYEVDEVGCEPLPGTPAPDPSWACTWCHGTGVPQLSAATMAMAVKA